METWTEFVLARYNYWIVIILMMLGLYIVFARGNLVKKIVGLNLFQTSVFHFLHHDRQGGWGYSANFLWARP